MDQLAAFLISVASTTIGAISAGGGLISIPGFIFLGLSPVSAIATTRLNVIAGGLTALFRYRKSNAVLWKYVPLFLVLGLVAGIAGPHLLLGINDRTVQTAIGVIMLVILPFLWIEKSAGLTNTKRSKLRQRLGIPVLFIFLLYTVMFGAGGGIFLIYTCVYFFGMNVTEANATSLTIAVFASSVAVIAYVNEGAINWHLGIPAIFGALVGGWIGAHLALKKGTAWVKVVLSIVIIVSGIKLLFFR